MWCKQHMGLRQEDPKFEANHLRQQSERFYLKGLPKSTQLNPKQIQHLPTRANLFLESQEAVLRYAFLVIITADNTGQVVLIVKGCAVHWPMPTSY